MAWNGHNITDYAIGIDTGVKTGYALWNKTKKCFDEISTLPIHRAMFKVKELHERGYRIFVKVEDARQAVHGRYGEQNAAKLQGAGSVKRDAKLWEDFLKDYNIPHAMVRPNKKLTKLDKTQFYNLTKYKGLTSSHSRDAACMVLGM